jgi:hypothetical protein
MSLANPESKKARASLPYVPLPPILGGMSLYQAMQKQQYQAEMAQGIADAQEEYFTKGFETGHLKG